VAAPLSGPCSTTTSSRWFRVSGLDAVIQAVAAPSEGCMPAPPLTGVQTGLASRLDLSGQNRNVRHEIQSGGQVVIEVTARG